MEIQISVNAELIQDVTFSPSFRVDLGVLQKSVAPGLSELQVR